MLQKSFKKDVVFSFLLFLNANSISASMRVDIPERTKEQVVENSIRLGENLSVAKITGSVQIEGIEGVQLAGTGVAIDRTTILTSAHLNNLSAHLNNLSAHLNNLSAHLNNLSAHLNNSEAESEIFFSLDSDARGSIDNCYKVRSLIIHPSFKRRERCLLGIEAGVIDPLLEYILEKKHTTRHFFKRLHF